MDLLQSMHVQSVNVVEKITECLQTSLKDLDFILNAGTVV